MDKFKDTCLAMGGEYESGIGSLEPDVGGEFLDTHKVRLKEWCKFEKMAGLGEGSLTIFNARNTFSIRVGNNGQLLEFQDNDIIKRFDKKEQKMCFQSEFNEDYAYCVGTFPLRPYGNPSGICIDDARGGAHAEKELRLGDVQCEKSLTDKQKKIIKDYAEVHQSYMTPEDPDYDLIEELQTIKNFKTIEADAIDCNNKYVAAREKARELREGWIDSLKEVEEEDVERKLEDGFERRLGL